MNLGLLYTAKGTSAFLVPVADLIKSSTMVFVVTAHRGRLGAFRAQTDAGTAGTRRVAIGSGSMPRPFSWIGQAGKSGISALV